MWGANYSPLSQMFPYDSSMFPESSRGWRYVSWSARCLAAATICLIGYTGYRSRREGSAPLRTFLAAFSIVLLGLTILAGHLPGVGGVPGALPVMEDLIEQRAQIFAGSFLTLEAALLCYWSLRRRRDDGLDNFFIGVALLSYFMMTRWSRIIWNTIHPLWSVQFPWRLNVFLTLATTGLAALAISDLMKRPLRQRLPGSVLAVIVWGLVVGGMARVYHVEDSFWATRPLAYEPAPDAPLPVYLQVKSLQEALDIMAPKNVDRNVFVAAGRGQGVVNIVHPRLIELHATCDSNCTLQIGQFYYPAWRAKLTRDGTEIPLRAASPGGLMEISLPPGESAVEIELPHGWSEQIGPWISLASLIFLVVFALSDKPAAGQPAAAVRGSPINL